MSQAYLVMADGRVFAGKPLGMRGQTHGEVVFNTSMTGYQEILTDPSYDGQMVAMTYPLIGNVGVNSEDVESRKVFLRGFIIKEESAIPSNFRSQMTLGAYLEENRIVGIQGLDTRALTRHIRQKGAMPAVISSDGQGIDALREQAARLKGLEGVDCVRGVTCQTGYQWEDGLWALGKGFSKPSAPPRFHVVAIDLGIKTNILRHLAAIGAAVTVVPATAGAEEILALKPDGVFLSNGPGDPEPVTYAMETARKLIGRAPVFGICLGHQILSLALGAKTYKLKFGHHGGNHPVKNLATGKVEITSQNHNFAVDPATTPANVKVTHINLNDNTVEGLESLQDPAFSIQYHPEASPGPHDASYLFQRFAALMDDNRG
ncbi:MAG: glutamine-hydrolyzing carbamoyl-phosphate synthase small subunit [Nitrospinota bacterium]|nr:glutamine-hydrolyzing carbamoyl-phosphate synthase small subunit [Nitrospinota bacterium]